MLNCNNNNSFKNSITIKINSIDKNTKQQRLNMFDTIEVRKEYFGYLKKTYKIVGKHVLNSKGSIKIKIDSTQGYRFFINGVDGAYGTENFTKGFTKEKLKDGQEINIEVFSLENR